MIKKEFKKELTEEPYLNGIGCEGKVNGEMSTDYVTECTAAAREGESEKAHSAYLLRACSEQLMRLFQARK